MCPSSSRIRTLKAVLFHQRWVGERSEERVGGGHLGTPVQPRARRAGGRRRRVADLLAKGWYRRVPGTWEILEQSKMQNLAEKNRTERQEVLEGVTVLMWPLASIHYCVVARKDFCQRDLGTRQAHPCLLSHINPQHESSLNIWWHDFADQSIHWLLIPPSPRPINLKFTINLTLQAD